MNDESMVARAYDALAPDYNAQLALNPVAVYMRAQLHAHLLRLFYSGDRVLDFTAGTGVDARFLAMRGIEVTALDASPLMIAELQKTIGDPPLPIKAHVLPAECLSELAARDFDGAISTFAGLNTIDNLPELARELHARLKPRGRLVFHALNSFCFWQWSAGFTHRRSTRSCLEVNVGGQMIRHQTYNPFDLWQTVFAAYFDRRSVYALSVLAAPSIVQRWPRLSRSILALDRIAGRIFPAAGDFFVMELERQG